MRILFLHPDLGIGGAERLVVDAALALKSAGHTVIVLTNHHDNKHCFPETRDGRLPVHVVAESVARSLFGRFHAACAYLRFVLAALYLVFWAPADSDLADCDVIFCDQISAPIPLLKLLPNSPRIIFYCHFPDQLLTKRDNFWKALYRRPIDWIEEVTTGSADSVLVNSRFTESVFRQTFPKLRNKHLKVVYPSCDFSAYDKKMTAGTNLKLDREVTAVFLSINRYERKKNLQLAVEATAELQKFLLNNHPSQRVHTIIAGGYDDRVQENKEYYAELVQLVTDLKAGDLITFLRSPTDDEKRSLLHACRAVIYTPTNEHFGIVPLEAMYMQRPVIACKSGGPLETIVDGETGFLCEPDAASFMQPMLRLVLDKSLAYEMGSEGKAHVVKNFSFSNFREQLLAVIQ